MITQELFVDDLKDHFLIEQMGEDYCVDRRPLGDGFTVYVDESRDAELFEALTKFEENYGY